MKCVEYIANKKKDLPRFSRVDDESAAYMVKSGEWIYAPKHKWKAQQAQGIAGHAKP